MSDALTAFSVKQGFFDLQSLSLVAALRMTVRSETNG
jgi:hypothetical protein